MFLIYDHLNLLLITIFFIYFDSFYKRYLFTCYVCLCITVLHVSSELSRIGQDGFTITINLSTMLLFNKDHENI